MANLNRNGLADEFNIENIETEVKQMVKQFNESDHANIEEILVQNVNRANRVLDRIEHEINNGNFNARISEVASQLINSVTNAASQISSDRYNTNYLQIRKSIVQLEKMKLDLKRGESGNSKITSQNIIVTDRESLLNLLKENKQIEQSNQKMIEKGGNNEQV